MMKITVIGAGYVGLVAATCFANFNIHVTCVDKDNSKVEALKNAIVPIYEPGLEEMLKKCISSKHISFSNNLVNLDESEAIIIAVGTPSAKDGSADLTYLFQAVEEIIENTSKHKTIIIKSTVPVGTAHKIRQLLEERGVSDRFDVVSNPEFLREGSAVYDFLNPDRIVLGVGSKKAGNIAKKLYSSLTAKNVQLILTDNTTAETIKYASNSYLAMRIAFINEIADFAEKVGADVVDIAKGMGADHRIGSNYLNPGPGYGGSCFPKDTNALAFTANAIGVDLTIVNSVIKSNDDRKVRIANNAARLLHDKGCKSIAILGVTFKADTDDMRDSPALDLIPILKAEGFDIKVYDPSMSKHAESLLTIKLQETISDCMLDVDAAIIVTEWQEFRTLSTDVLAENLNKKLLIDLRNLFDPKEMSDSGIEYHSIGRKPSTLKNAANSGYTDAA